MFKGVVPQNPKLMAIVNNCEFTKPVTDKSNIQNDSYHNKNHKIIL